MFWSPSGPISIRPSLVRNPIRSLPQGGVTAAAVQGGVRQLMDNPSYRATASRIRGEILALPTPVERIDDLVALLA